MASPLRATIPTCFLLGPSRNKTSPIKFLISENRGGRSSIGGWAGDGPPAASANPGGEEGPGEEAEEGAEKRGEEATARVRSSPEPTGQAFRGPAGPGLPPWAHMTYLKPFQDSMGAQMTRALVFQQGCCFGHTAHLCCQRGNDGSQVHRAPGPRQWSSAPPHLCQPRRNPTGLRHLLLHIRPCGKGNIFEESACFYQVGDGGKFEAEPVT
ncbi:uncharacterized protein C7orf50 homolog isoform X6 [Canis lupus familiaris]|uniref:uncharacterized protein C7orf50 homolog isoform X6 n=1 Tax=Canis lupus familiaris TaxID=9615 RepID=UPI000BAA0239|nr:uncharacterized protein C7orf50 homolog isoform X6 [Canis lupus familiaris]|eukprot:XP_022275528.1 uncharacterized protein C7orf50 homolog isoform X4 [Canis lupus familiaris]